MIKIKEEDINFNVFIENYNYYKQIYNHYSFYDKFQKTITGEFNIFFCITAKESVEDKIKNYINENKDLFKIRKGIIGTKIRSLEDKINRYKDKGKINQMKKILKLYEYEFFLINKYQMYDKLNKKLQTKGITEKKVKI